MNEDEVMLVNEFNKIFKNAEPSVKYHIIGMFDALQMLGSVYILLTKVKNVKDVLGRSWDGILISFIPEDHEEFDKENLEEVSKVAKLQRFIGFKDDRAVILLIYDKNFKIPKEILH